MVESDIFQKFLDRLKPGNHFWVAFSGGLDSSVLLHLLANSALRHRIRALHIHHGLSVYADEWAAHCQNVCRQLCVPVEIKTVDVSTTGKGLEEAARQARYRQFEAVLKEGDLMATGHHADDQVETMLFRLARGAGLKGLGAMASERACGRGRVVRPLLSSTRSQLADYALTNNLIWVTDDSNTDEKYDRNYLRHTVIPSFVLRWPAFIDKVANTTRLLRLQQELLNEYLAEDLVACDRQFERLGESVCIDTFTAFSPARQNALLRFWMTCLGYQAISTKQLSRLGDVLFAKADANPTLDVGGVSLKRYRCRLYLCPRHARPVSSSDSLLTWDGKAPILLKGGFSLRCVGAPTALPTTEFTIKFDKSGIRCKPVGRGHSQALKKLLHSYQLEPWLRDFVPLVYHQDTLLAVGDMFYCHERAAALLGQLKWEYGGLTGL